MEKLLTLAQLKRDLKVGTKLKLVYHYFCQTYVETVREISKVSKEYVSLWTKTEDSRMVESRLYFPKSDYIEYNGKSIKIYCKDNRELAMEYEIVG